MCYNFHNLTNSLLRQKHNNIQYLSTPELEDQHLYKRLNSVCLTNERNIIMKVYNLHVNNSFLSDFNKTWKFSTDFRKILKYQISWKSVKLKPKCTTWTDRHDEARKRLMKIGKKILRQYKPEPKLFYGENYKQIKL